jgi:hypothetical protein
VGIAQLAEHRTVAPTVAGSIPVSHPNFKTHHETPDCGRTHAGLPGILPLALSHI